MAEPREALVPHLRATLGIAWSAPPDDVRDLLAALDRLSWRETSDHELYLDRRDGPAHADPARMGRYRRALAEVRALASASARLDLDLMLRVQTIVLEAPATVRTTTAFAKGGLEAYAWFDGMEAMLRRKVVADAADGCHALIQACRLYLDIIFFHPFADGNARAARLWFDFLLRRSHVMAPPFEDVVRLEKPAGDPDAAWRFVRLAAKRALAMHSDR